MDVTFTPGTLRTVPSDRKGFPLLLRSTEPMAVNGTAVTPKGQDPSGAPLYTVALDTAQASAVGALTDKARAAARKAGALTLPDRIVGKRGRKSRIGDAF